VGKMWTWSAILVRVLPVDLPLHTQKLMPAKALAVDIHDICMLCITTHMVSMCSSK